MCVRYPAVLGEWGQNTWLKWEGRGAWLAVEGSATVIISGGGGGARAKYLEMGSHYLDMGVIVPGIGGKSTLKIGLDARTRGVRVPGKGVRLPEKWGSHYLVKVLK